MCELCARGGGLRQKDAALSSHPVLRMPVTFNSAVNVLLDELSDDRNHSQLDPLAWSAASECVFKLQSCGRLADKLMRHDNTPDLEVAFDLLFMPVVRLHEVAGRGVVNGN